ncbi:hypothetical protein [Nannocystis punicea]|uniref:Uncharacterized protein n=1 Tax=Nannocystis punicea TaxID=2995304 RepID=A0ABY7HAI1_9BACT|nr:hypothetical protein [Nannocystis poenicansa]WAS96100.1 hypothetical protein O0S08_08040 [Nannocystis poenicansa]
MVDGITPERVREIVAMADRPVLRNLLITRGYHRLTLAMAQVLDQGDFTWPIFATWASKQAGQFIREEELGAGMTTLLAARMPAVLDSVTLRAPIRRALTQIARHVITGNTLVFEELGVAFATFAGTFAEPAARTEERLADVVALFSEGPSLADVVTMADDGTLERRSQGGQTMIREALAYYFMALHERSAAARAELVLLANGLCGLHEQTRLQPYIGGALAAPLAGLAGDEGTIGAALATVMRRAATELMMTMALPGQVLRLGSDLPAPPGQPLWPEALARLEHPRLLQLTEELGAYAARERGLGLVDRLEDWLRPGEPEVQGSGADDWSRLGDRMRYIFEYFRSRQRDASLLVSPFSPAQEQDLLAGRVPTGPL